MPEQTGKISLQVTAALHFPGCLPGMRQSGLVAYLKVATPEVASAEETLDSLLGSIFSNYHSDLALSGGNAHRLGIRIARVVSLILQGAGFPVFEEYVVLSDPESEDFRVVLPGFDPDCPASRRALDWTLELFNGLLEGKSADPWKNSLETFLRKLERHAPQGMNSLRFINAADELDIPWKPLAGNTIQLGHGRKARWLDSSFTDVTPNIAARLSRNKFEAARLLSRAGIPVPAHRLAGSSQEAVQIAGQLGYPVVIKPADLDGGEGVTPGLETPEMVRKAYDKARALSRNVLVEKHIEGNDYRLQVFSGEVFWAVHRIPGGVTGDGSRSIAELLAEKNAISQHKAGDRKTRLKPVAMDDEAIDLLKKQGLTPDTIPAAGSFVRLRRTANVTAGGNPVPVLDQAHPDNLALAVRAARILRLDVAGVDLLIPDISRSWLETGCAICEVNGQPQLSPHLPRYLLQRLVEGNGRIPIILMVGQITQMPWLDALKQTLGVSGCLGIAEPGGLWVGEERVGQGGLDVYHGPSALLIDNKVQRLLIIEEDALKFCSGFPADRIDVLIVAGGLRAGTAEIDPEASVQVSMDAAGISRHVLVLQDCAEADRIAKELSHQSLTRCPAKTLPEVLAGLLP